MKINKKIPLKSQICLLLFIGMLMPAFSQIQNPSNDFWSKVRFGGGIGLSFGDGFFSGTLAPSAIYQFNSKFATGVGLSFTYNEQDNFYSSTIFGSSILGLYNPIPEIQLSTEFELLNIDRSFDDPVFVDDNYWYPALFLGVGYGNRNVTFGIRYDILYDRDDSIYADPWIPFVRVFF